MLYNWEYGKDNGDDFGDGETAGGLTFGAGLDYFTTQSARVKFEGRHDWVAVDDGRPDPSGVSLTVGVKKFF